MANIFKFATSELSQDAFLCWLFASIGGDLYEKSESKQTVIIAKRILFKLLEIQENDDAEVKINWISQQWRKLDVVVEASINGKTHLLAIEDKVKTNVHDKNGKEESQLDIYYQALINHWNEDIKNWHVKCIIYKTSFLREDDHKHGPQWKEYGINEIIELFREARKGFDKIESDILLQYIKHLEFIDSCFKKDAVIDKWQIWRDRDYDLAYENLFNLVHEKVKEKYHCWINYYRGMYLTLIVSRNGKGKLLPSIEIQPRSFLFNEDAILVKFSIEGYNLDKEAYNLVNVKKWQDNLKKAGFGTKRTATVLRFLDDDKDNNPKKSVNLVCKFVEPFGRDVWTVEAFSDKMAELIGRIFDAIEKE